MKREINQLLMTLNPENFSTRLYEGGRTLVVTYRTTSVGEIMGLRDMVGGIAGVAVGPEGFLNTWQIVGCAAVQFAYHLLPMLTGERYFTLNACLHAARNGTEAKSRVPR